MQRLHELGWIEDRTIAIEYRWEEGRFDRSAEVIAGPENWLGEGQFWVDRDDSGRQRKPVRFTLDCGIGSDVRDGREVPCVDGSELARRIFTLQGLVGAAMCSAC